jgi:hypothetical protein
MNMLRLDSPKWSKLRHCYGPATNLPVLLRQLADFPPETSSMTEPWETLWSSLYHQGDIYPASFAAVPHIIGAIAADPQRATMSYFALPAAIEVARWKGKIKPPKFLLAGYQEALACLPGLAAASARLAWDPHLCQSALAAVAAATGNHEIAELLIEVEHAEIPEVVDWIVMR